LYLGLVWTKAGHLPEAVSSIRRAIEIRRDGIGYHFALGVVLRRQGEMGAALEAFKAELVNNPAQAAASEQIAEIEGELRK
jgi:tetratricopeptide (TPR) repeat protein